MAKCIDLAIPADGAINTTVEIGSFACSEKNHSILSVLPHISLMVTDFLVSSVKLIAKL